MLLVARELGFRKAPVAQQNEYGHNAGRLKAAAGSHGSAAAKPDRGRVAGCGNPDCGGKSLRPPQVKGEAVNLRRDSPPEGVATQTPLAIPFPNSILQPKS